MPEKEIDEKTSGGSFHTVERGYRGKTGGVHFGGEERNTKIGWGGERTRLKH